MIHSVLQNKEIPVSITKEKIYEYHDAVRYIVHDASEPGIHVGYVSLMNTKNGVFVISINNQHPNLYKHFGEIADQIEVEHCLNRGIKNPYIKSVAAFNSHIQHFKRGKRFINEGINIYLENVCQNLQKGEKVLTRFLGLKKMYMPVNLINEIKEKIKINPLLKGIK